MSPTQAVQWVKLSAAAMSVCLSCDLLPSIVSVPIVRWLLLPVCLTGPEGRHRRDSPPPYLRQIRTPGPRTFLLSAESGKTPTGQAGPRSPARPGPARNLPRWYWLVPAPAAQNAGAGFPRSWSTRPAAPPTPDIRNRRSRRSAYTRRRKPSAPVSPRRCKRAVWPLRYFFPRPPEPLPHSRRRLLQQLRFHPVHQPKIPDPSYWQNRGCWQWPA